MKPSAKASAPAKVILFGEHFVVYCGSAILASIDRRVTATVNADKSGKISLTSALGSIVKVREEVSGFSEGDGGSVGKIGASLADRANEGLRPLVEAATRILAGSPGEYGLDIRIDSEIPSGIGLGSSAAACVATVAAVGSILGIADKRWICERAIEAEGTIHGTTSGADCYVSAYGGLVSFSRSAGMEKIEKQVAPALVVSNTGIIHSTREQVSKVDLFRKRNEAEFQRIFDDYGQVHKQALNALGSGDFDKIGMLMSRNQQLLRDIGVSHPRAEEIIEIAIREGAYGAKVTGSGGGGAVIALAQDPQSGRRIAEKLRVAGYESFASTIDPSGVILT